MMVKERETLMLLANEEVELDEKPSARNAGGYKETRSNKILPKISIGNMSIDQVVRCLLVLRGMEEVEHIDEAPYQVMGSPDGKKEKKIGKPVKSRKYADARAAELSDTHKKTGGKFRIHKYVEALDPVGKEDGDVNNDGKKDSSDSYLRRSVVRQSPRHWARRSRMRKLKILPKI